MYLRNNYCVMGLYGQLTLSTDLNLIYSNISIYVKMKY